MDVGSTTTESEGLEIEEVVIPNNLEQCKKKSRRKRGKCFDPLPPLAESMPGKYYMEDPGMDYYNILGLQSSASCQEIHEAYCRLSRPFDIYFQFSIISLTYPGKTHDPQSGEGKLKWQGEDATILQDMEHIWNNIQCAFEILSQPFRRSKYNSKRQMYLKYFEVKRDNIDEEAVQSQLQFAALREELVRSLEVPHPDDPPEPYNENFFKRVTAGIVIEKKDIDFSINYYSDLMGHLYQSKKIKRWNGVIGQDIFGKLLRDMGVKISVPTQRL